MKLAHLSDLHLGRRLNEFSLCEDQVFMLRAVLAVIRDEKPDAVLIAGDVYDKPMPSLEAVGLLDFFLVSLSEMNVKTLIISGNHDAPERVAFGARLMRASGVYLAPAYAGCVTRVSLEDEHGFVRVHLLPFIKPAHVRRYFPDAHIENGTDAMRAVLDGIALSPAERNVLVAHQYVTGAARCESEETSLGGADNVDACVFDRFDYVALGHLHGAQRALRDTVRYCGSPLKYSFSECAHHKSITFVELGKKGDVAVRAVPVVPLRDVREIRGRFLSLLSREADPSLNTDDYIRAVLTDDADIPDAVARLRTVYPHIARLDYDNARTRSLGVSSGAKNPSLQSPLALFEALFEAQNGQTMNAEQRATAQRMLTAIWEEGAQ